MKIKSIIAVIVIFAILLCGCSSKSINNNIATEEQYEFTDIMPEFYSLDDDDLLRYVEDNIYRETITELDSEQYFVENVSAEYVSKEYLDELAFNSQTNIFFGYSLADVKAAFDGKKYVFTVGDNDETTVVEFQDYDDTFEKVLTKVAIGTGVILVCVTVSIVTGGAGAPAVSMIFAASAKTGAIMALSSGGIGAVTAGIVTGVQTKDFDQAMKAAATAGSDGFMWGAIGGTVLGGTSEAIALKGATLNGLTMDEAAIIQKESKLPLNMIKDFKSIDEYNIYKNAGLFSTKLSDGSRIMLQNINPNYVDEFGRTNLERMNQGLAALDSSGNSFELHHIGQKTDSVLAVLTKAEHMQGGNHTILHDTSISSSVHCPGNNWDEVRQSTWKLIAKLYER